MIFILENKSNTTWWNTEKKWLDWIPKKAESVAYAAKLRRLKKYKNDRLYNRFNAQNVYYCNVFSFI